VLATLTKINRKELIPNIWAGTITAIVISIISAILMNALGTEFKGTGEAIFEGITMLLAAAVLTVSILWIKNQQGRITVTLGENVNKALDNGGGWGLFLLAFLSVARDGIELALFIFATNLKSNPAQEIFGILLGLLTAVLIGWGIFSSSLSFSSKRFFLITNLVFLFFAAGLVGMGLHEFIEVGLISPIIPAIWDLSAIIPNDSFFGQFLTVLAGYQSDPSLIQVLGYVSYILLVGWTLFFTRTVRQPAANLPNLE
jgi:high-affinity iron transporter